jgi:hypothetical protein
MVRWIFEACHWIGQATNGNGITHLPYSIIEVRVTPDHVDFGAPKTTLEPITPTTLDTMNNSPTVEITKNKKST